MEAYLPISFLNDFIFCPRSIYFHQLYGRVSQKVYHQTPQTKGLAAHKTVDEKRYSTSANALQSLEVYSHRYNIAGKIDVFDQASGVLTERKKKIKVVYDGYIFQLYAQCFALQDMGFNVKKIRLYSMDDNKVYPVDMPHDNQQKVESFESLLEDIRTFTLSNDFQQNPNKCKNCIYSNLCDTAELAPC